MIKSFFLAISILLTLSGCSADREYTLSADLDSFYAQQPRRFEQLFSEINLDYTGLEKTKKAVQDEDYLAAAYELLDYYRKSRWSSVAANTPVPEGDDIDPEKLFKAQSNLNDTFIHQRVTGPLARLENGLMDWQHRGPNNDEEWAHYHNRHYFFGDLLHAYQVKSDEAFSRYFDATVIDWIYQNPPPLHSTKTPAWDAMSAGSRMLSSWPQAFYGFNSSANFSPLARIMMLMSVPEHAEYLQKYHSRHHNHAVKEMSGLANLAVYWPEFKQSDEWFEYAANQMVDEVQNDVYPDGVHKELSGHYHNNVRAYFNKFVDIAGKGNRELPPIFNDQINRMSDYSAATMRPNGYGLNNNDADMDYMLDIILEEARKSGRDDWLYIATYGDRGKPPDFTSSFYPYAGQLIMRDNWSRKANWGFFDVGPWGTSHQHNDKLHLSISAYGADILVDAGRYIYEDGPARNYFTGSRGHNIILIDGQGQNKYPGETKEPITEDNFQIADTHDFAIGTFDAGFGPLETVHSRAVFFDKKNTFWLIVDSIELDQPRDITVLWHFHPEVSVTEEGGALSAHTTEGSLRICPVGIQIDNINLVSGQTDPYIQGWWSMQYNHKDAATAAEINATLEQSTAFAWLMIPYTDTPPQCDATLLHQDGKGLAVEVPSGDTSQTISLDFHQRPHLKVN